MFLCKMMFLSWTTWCSRCWATIVVFINIHIVSVWPGWLAGAHRHHWQDRRAVESNHRSAWGAWPHQLANCNCEHTGTMPVLHSLESHGNHQHLSNLSKDSSFTWESVRTRQFRLLSKESGGSQGEHHQTDI